MIAIVDYNAGNLTSVKLALDYLGVNSEITRDPERILAADRVIFPGVGSAGAAMQNIRALGLADVLQQVVQRGTPFLGICLGTQIIFEASEEDGGIQGLGILAGTVKRFYPTNPADKVPQIGWNGVTFVKPHPLLEGIESGSVNFISYTAITRRRPTAPVCWVKPNMPMSTLHRLSPGTTWRPPNFTLKNRGAWVCRY